MRALVTRLLGRIKLVLLLLPLLSFWLPVRPGASVLIVLACILALLSSLQRSRWLQDPRWRVARSDWRKTLGR